MEKAERPELLSYFSFRDATTGKDHSDHLVQLTSNTEYHWLMIKNPLFKQFSLENLGLSSGFIDSLIHSILMEILLWMLGLRYEISKTVKAPYFMYRNYFWYEI